jgi:hypothetical protein
MRLIVREGPGKVGLNFMWLPTFLGMDNNLKKQLEADLGPKLKGKPLDDTTLDFAHDEAVDFICKYHKAIPGLRDYLDAIKFVDDSGKSA